MSYFVRTEQLTVGYHGKPVIRNMEIEIQTGEIVTLIGPNGAGKSTILKSIARQLELISGTVYLQQENLQEIPRQALAKKMSIVLTEKLRTECMTCEEVVATGRYPYTGRFGFLTEADQNKVEEAMELVRVTNLRDLDFTKVSDGQRQRVMLARAICQEPEIILLDEPTSFLDVKHKLEFLSMLQLLRKTKQMTVIMSLHELDLAQRVSDHMLCIKGETVDRYGTPEEIYVAGYLQSLFDVTVGKIDEESSSVELAPPNGPVEHFVIGGAGSGRMVYRRLQRQGHPFFTGILFDNDLDYPVAAALAAEVIVAKAFEQVEEQTLQEAKERIATCRTVICCRNTFAPGEQFNANLLEYARALGKEIEME